MSKILFVVGTGRCGTHTLERVLSTVPGTVSLHEGRGSLSGKKVDVGHMNGLNVYLYNCPDRPKAAELTAVSGDVARLISANFEARHDLIRTCCDQELTFCDSNRHAYNYIPYIAREYPQARFIHLIRNGFDCVRSWHQRGETYPEPRAYKCPVRLAMARQLLTMHRFSPRIVQRLIPILGRLVGVDHNYLIAPVLSHRTLTPTDIHTLSNPVLGFYCHDKPVPFPDSEISKEWGQLPRMQKTAWFWSNVNKRIRKMLSDLSGDRSMTVRLEDLSQEHVGEMLEFAGLPGQFDANLIKPHDARDHSGFDWNDERVDGFRRHASGCMAEFGYSLAVPQ